MGSIAKYCLQIQQSSHTHELAVTGAACIEPEQDHGRQNPRMDKEPMKFTLSEEQLMMAHGRKVGFLQGHYPEEAAFAPVESPTLRYIQAAKGAASVLKRAQEVRREKDEVEEKLERKEWGGFDLNVSFACVNTK